MWRNADKSINDKIEVSNYDFKYTDEEIKIFKKISQWPKCVDVATAKLEPHRIPVYLYELSSEFHAYWNLGKDDKSKRFINFSSSIEAVHQSLFTEQKFVNLNINMEGRVTLRNHLTLFMSAKINPHQGNDFYESRTGDFINPVKLSRSIKVRTYISTDYRNSFAIDLKKWLSIMKTYENGGHAYHTTMPTDSLTHFRDTMLETKEYGFDKLYKNQWELGNRVRDLLKSKNIKSVAADGFRAPGVVVSYTNDENVHNGIKLHKNAINTLS